MGYNREANKNRLPVEGGIALSGQPYQLGLARPGDVEELMDLWRYCFLEDRGGAFVPWYFQNCFSPATTYVARAQQLGRGKIAAAVYAPSYPLVCRGKILRVPYIQGVAIPPEYRGRGAASAALRFALEDLRRQGCALAVLKPFDPAFYERSGWAFFAYLNKYHFALSKLPAAKPDKRLHFQTAGPEFDRWEELLAVYEGWLQNLLGISHWVRRNKDSFAKLLADHFQDGGSLLLAYDESEKLTGYLLYTLSGNEFFVRELAYTSLPALHSLLALAREHSSQVNNLLLVAPQCSQSRALLPDLLSGLSSFPFAMARLLDFAGAFGGIPVAAAANYQGRVFYLELLDEQLPEQAGLWQLWLEKGATKVEKMPDLAKTPEKTIKIEQNLLTKIYLGCYNFKDHLRRQSGCNAEQWEAAVQLDGLLPQCASYFYEYF